MAKSKTLRSTASTPSDDAAAATSRELHGAAYHTAWQTAWRDIEALQPGEIVLYHEGHLAADSLDDPATAGRAAAFWDAALEHAKGTLTQRRLKSDLYQYIFRRSPA